MAAEEDGTKVEELAEELAIETDAALVEDTTAAAADELTGALPVQPSPGTATSRA